MPVCCHDETCADLMPLEHALLWYMRAWAHGCCGAEDLTQARRGILATLAAERAVPYLDGLMWVMAHGVRRALAMHCVCNPMITGDEASLLAALSVVHAGRRQQAVDLLGDMLTPGAVAAACESIARVVLVLQQAGHVLPSRQGARERTAPVTLYLH